MRVLYLGANFRMQLSASSGPQIRALGLKQGLEQAGVEVLPLMAGDQTDTESARSAYQGTLKRLLPRGIAGALRDAYEIVNDRRLFRRIEPRVREIAPDVILQQHTRYAQVGVRLSRKYGIPIFLDDITPIWEGEQYSDRRLKLLARYVRKRVFAQASGLIAVSRDLEAQLRSENVPSHRIYFVPNGADCTVFDPDATSTAVRQEYGLADKTVVGYVGGFERWHKLGFFMRVACSVAEMLPNVHFLLVGHDPGGCVENMAHERGLSDRFTFTGRVAHSEVPLYLNAMDITVLPSTLPYMSPIKIYEYMAMRKPVIAPSGNSITEEVVIPYKNGLLFEVGSEDALKDAIVMLATNPELRQRMGVEARQWVQDNFTWYHQGQKLLRAFEAAVASSAG
jgi:glycosyltransferase involved in cell wall biosynthesis